MTERLEEARMSAAVKLQRAFEREQQKSAASRQRGQELLKQAKEKQEQKAQQTNEETVEQSSDRKKQLKKFKDMVDCMPERVTEGTVQPTGSDKIEVAGNDVPAKEPKGKTVKPFKFFTTNESYTFDTAAMAKQELADAKNKKHRKRGKVANLLRKLGMKEEMEVDAQINEVLSKDASAGDWIHDFVHSDNPKFAGKSKAKRKEMALAAYYAKQRNEEVEQIDELKQDTVKKYKEFSTLNAVGHASNIYDREVEGGKKPDPEMHRKLAKRKEGIARADARLKKEETEMEQIQQEGVLDKIKTAGKKALETLGHGSDEQLRKDLQKKVGVPQTGQKPKKLREFIEGLKEGKVAKEVNVDKVHAAGQEPHEEKWEDAKKVKKESFTADQLLQALKEGLWPGTPEHTAKFGDKYKQQQGGGAGIKKGTRYGGSAQKPEKEDDNDADDTPAKKPKNK